MLSRLEAAYLAEFDLRLRSSEFCSLSLAHSRNVLRHLGDGPQRASNLVALSGVTKQAISQQIVQLERVGLIRTEPDPADQRARLVVLTERGCRAMQLVRKTFLDIEQDWGRHLGDGELAALRDALSALLERTAAGAELEPDC